MSSGFSRAEQETPVPLLTDVFLVAIKDWFKEQAIFLGKDWLGG